MKVKVFISKTFRKTYIFIFTREKPLSAATGFMFCTTSDKSFVGSKPITDLLEKLHIDGAPTIL